jgi:hypothetical protein
MAKTALATAANLCAESIKDAVHNGPPMRALHIARVAAGTDSDDRS